MPPFDQIIPLQNYVCNRLQKKKVIILLTYIIIANSIQNDFLSKGLELPSERSLASKYDVARLTIRKALSYLEEIGVLERTASGYVKNAYRTDIITRMISAQEYQTIDTEIRKIDVKDSNRFQAKRLHIPLGQKIVDIDYKIKKPHETEAFILVSIEFPFKDFEVLTTLKSEDPLKEYLSVVGSSVAREQQYVELREKDSDQKKNLLDHETNQVFLRSSTFTFKNRQRLYLTAYTSIRYAQITSPFLKLNQDVKEND